LSLDFSLDGTTHMAHCLRCGNEGLLRLRAYRPESPLGKRLFGGASVYRCPECGVAQMAPVPSTAELDSYYAHDYRTEGRYGSDRANTRQFPYDNLLYSNRGESVAALLTPYLDGRASGGALRILDVGAGFGHILYALAQRYPRSERVAVETSRPCVEHLRSLGVTVLTVPAAEVLPTLKDRFDLVILSHVLEHLPDPFATLSMLRRCLVSGGVLFVEVPNVPLDALTGYPEHAWYPRTDEPHLTFLSRETLRSGLESDGWTVSFSDTVGPEYRLVSWLRFHTPRLRPLVLGLLPNGLKAFLRRQRFTQSLRVRDREPSFYEYGGPRIWLRTVATPSA